MQLRCKTCGAPLISENINLETYLAKCEYCNSITYFGEMMRPSKASAAEYEDRYRTEQKDSIDRHDRFCVEEWGEQLTVKYSWFTWSVWFLVLFCVAWDGFLVFWYVTGITQGAPWMMLVFPVIHVAVGVGLTYAVVCCFVNSTTIQVDPEQFQVTHGPLPCGTNVTLPTDQLEQLYCKEEIKRSKNSTSYKYSVMAKQTDGKEKKLITGFDDMTQAVYLERLFEKHLQIEDQYVGGEHRM